MRNKTPWDLGGNEWKQFTVNFPWCIIHFPMNIERSWDIPRSPVA